jgi:hypothetical protein
MISASRECLRLAPVGYVLVVAEIVAGGVSEVTGSHVESSCRSVVFVASGRIGKRTMSPGYKGSPGLGSIVS